MNTKAVQFQNALAVEVGTDFGFTSKKEIKENNKIKSLSCNNQKSKIYTYTEKSIKRFVDILAGIVGLIILIPLTLLVYIANRLEKDKGPVFFVQERIGKNGKVFKMFKYRSMVVGADEKLKKYLENNEEAKQEYKKYKKLKNDPRVTKVGKFLRKTSLDEMPQLINILIGEMSLVGPRPYLPREKKEMGKYYDIIIKNTPGLTGLWQTRGRSNATFDDRLDLDIIYDKQKSLKNDAKILCKTVMDVIKKDGAI